MRYEDIEEAVAATGLLARGGFHPEAQDAVPPVGEACPARTLVLIGSAGPSAWTAFERARPPGPNPLERWTRARVEPLAALAGARAVYPEDQPFLPFLRWAQRAQDVHASPLGLLIDPEYGLWHSYRAALLLPTRIDVPSRGARPSPCDSCAGRPCLPACPVNAFRVRVFDSGACHGHLATTAGADCLDAGCKARSACPVAPAQRYAPAQIRFHMAAFHPKPK